MTTKTRNKKYRGLALSPSPIVIGTFIERPNRFIAHVVLENGEKTIAHVPNTGRLRELLVAGVPIKMAYNPSPTRKTDYTLLAVLYDGVWVCIHSVFANAIAAEYVGGLPGVDALKREVTYGNSRFDLGFNYYGQPALFEVKSANLVKDGIAMFPDAPTTRGSKHLCELMAAKKEGFYTGVLFVVQRGDAKFFTPNIETDSTFAQHLARCWDAGIDIRALSCHIDGDTLLIDTEIPVCLGGRRTK